MQRYVKNVWRRVLSRMEKDKQISNERVEKTRPAYQAVRKRKLGGAVRKRE